MTHQVDESKKPNINNLASEDPTYERTELNRDKNLGKIQYS